MTAGAGPSSGMREEEDGDEIEGEHRLEAFERQYLDDRSWENLVEKDGMLVARQEVGGQRKSARVEQTAGRVRRGMIRYMHLVLDMSAVCSATTDMRPNRAVALAQMAQRFITEFFDQNPLSQMSVLAMRHGRTEVLSELSPTPEVHKRALKSSLQTGGEVSLQNMLEFCTQAVSLVPPYGMREALVLLSSLTTCDPGSVADAIKAAQKANLRVSIIGLSAEMYISSRIAIDTSATYRVALSEEHLKELVMAACAPPALHGTSVDSKLVRMGFPSKDPVGAKSATFAGEGCSVMGGAYTCPACGAKNETIPCECHVCKLTLISAAHLARSYHHLFPIQPFNEIEFASLQGGADVQCSFCEQVVSQGAGVKSMYRCGSCNFLCCAQCDEFVHESLHNCPGCEAAT